MAGQIRVEESRVHAQSLVQLGADALRRMILSGQLGPGDRLVEERLTEQLGISRAPLREALRLLQQQGLVVNRPRHGSTVADLTEADVHEILTLRSTLERMAVELGVPAPDPAWLRTCEAAIERMENSARVQDRASLVDAGYDFHASIIALPGHRRLAAVYESLHLQLLLCMARNLYAREHHHEDLQAHAARHRELFELIKTGDVDQVLAALARHGERSFSTDT